MIHALAGFAFLAAAIKVSRGGSFGGLGTIPPPPTDDDDFLEWGHKTFKRGTRVRFLRPAYAYTIEDGTQIAVPAGTIAYSEAFVGFDENGMARVLVRGFKDIDLFTSTTRQWWTNNYFLNPERPADFILEPIDDNWGALTTMTARSYKAGWTPSAPKYKGRP